MKGLSVLCGSVLSAGLLGLVQCSSPFHKNGRMASSLFTLDLFSSFEAEINFGRSGGDTNAATRHGRQGVFDASRARRIRREGRRPFVIHTHTRSARVVVRSMTSGRAETEFGRKLKTFTDE